MYSWIRRERQKRKLSQAKLSALTGIAQVHLSAWEHRKSKPKPAQRRTVLAGFAKYDELVRSGKEKDFRKKTRWSKDYNSSRGAVLGRAGIDRNAVEAFAKNVHHSVESAERFSHTGLRLNGISLFSGCGGMAMGFHGAGIKIVGHVEINDAAREVFQHNFCDSKELATDIRQVTDNDLHDQKCSLPRIDIIFGGPPCQGFSLTGKRDVYDPRNQLYKDFARFVAAFRPRVFVLENVRLLTSMKTPSGSLLISDLLRTFSSLNYTVDYAELNALSYGVPQFRERLFVIGISRDIYGSREVEFPLATHGTNDLDLFREIVEPPLTLRDAIGDLEFLESGEFSTSDPLHFAVSHPTHVLEMLRDVPPGASAHENPNPALRPKSGYNTTYKRLRWDEPASTISTTFGMISGSRNVHPTATRSLTIREALRCQSFPDDFVVFGPLGEVRTMIGNAVPPKLARCIAQHLCQAYFDSFELRQLVEVASL